MNIENLKQARKKSGLTQKQVADKLGIGQSTYKNYEGGLREPNGDTVIMLADLFKVSTDYLLGRDTGEPTAIDNLQTEYDVSEFEKKVIAGYLSLPEHLRGDLMEYLEKLAKEFVEKGEN